MKNFLLVKYEKTEKAEMPKKVQEINREKNELAGWIGNSFIL